MVDPQLKTETPWGKNFASAIAIALALSATAVKASEFPGKDWPTDNLKTAVDLASPSCRDFVDYSFHQPRKDVIRTDGVVVIHQGKMVYERYRPVSPTRTDIYQSRYEKDIPHILWSASKSVTATLLGAAIEKSAPDLSLTTRLSEDRFFPANWRNNAAGEARSDNTIYEKITIRDLLEMGAGFRWSESYEADPKNSSIIEMIYLEGLEDMAKYALLQPMAAEPSTLWNYSSGNLSIVLAVLKKYYEPKGEGHSFPWTLLFDRLQFSQAVLEADGAGVYVGSSYIHLRPQDMAKLGYLYLQNGKWGADQILPLDWVHRTTQIATPYLSPNTKIEDTTADGVYGMTWWLNRPLLDEMGNPLPGKPSREIDHYRTARNNGATIYKEKPMPYPDVDEDFYGAFGHYGQYLFVLPSRNLVLVRTADDRDPKQFDVNYWVKNAVQCFSERRLP